MLSIVPYLMFLQCGLALVLVRLILAGNARKLAYWGGGTILCGFSLFIFKKEVFSLTPAQDLALALFLVGASIKLILSHFHLKEASRRHVLSDLKRLARVQPELTFLIRSDLQNELMQAVGLRLRWTFLAPIISLTVLVPLHSIFMDWSRGVPGISQLLLFELLIFVSLAVPRYSAVREASRAHSTALYLAFLILFGCLAHGTTETGLAFVNGVLAVHCLCEVYVRAKTWNEASSIVLPNRIFEARQFSFQNLNQIDLPPKAQRLFEIACLRLVGASCNRFRVCETIVTSTEMEQGEIVKRLGSSQSYIVRACLPTEDGVSASMAGQSLSLVDVQVGSLAGALKKVLSSLPPGGVSLIHPYIQTKFSGVIFSTSLENSYLTQIEYFEGQCIDLVSGKTQPSTILIGKRSGEVQHLDSHLDESIVRRLFILSQILEARFGHPQDIEWGYDSKRDEIFIFQSRDVTVLQGNRLITEHQERAIRQIFNINGMNHERQLSSSAMRKAAIYEVTRAASPMTRSIMSRVYSAQGSLGTAFSMLGNARSGYSIFEFFGCLYESCEQIKLNSTPASTAPAKDEIGNNISRLKNEHYELRRDQTSEAGGAITISRHVLVLSKMLVEQVFPLCLYANLRAQFDGEDSIPSASGAFIDSLRRLAAVAEYGENQGMDHIEALILPEKLLSQFLENFGHHSHDSYEVSVERFAENLDSLKLRLLEYRALDSKRIVGPQENNWVTLREDAKDLAVRYVSSIRSELLRLASACGLKTVDEVFLLRLEVLTGILELPKLSGESFRSTIMQAVEREKLLAKSFNSLALPATLSVRNVEFLNEVKSSIKQDRMFTTPVSVKTAVLGVPVDFRRVSQPGNLMPTNAILFVEWLDPSLFPFFTKARAIVSKRGGKLSHLAILGREYNFPLYVSEEVFEEGIRRTESEPICELSIDDDGVCVFR